MNKIINKTQKKTSKSYKDYLGARIFEGDYVYYRGIFNGLFGYTFQEGVYRVRKITKKDGLTEVKLHMSDQERTSLVYEKIIKIKEKEMNKAVKELDFETAAILRDEIGVLKMRLEKK